MNLLPKVIKHWDLFVLFLLVIIYTLVFSQLSILRHQAFASNFDLANMNQTVWNTLHGRPFALSGAEGTISRFSIHADIILVLVSPLYLLWERATTLLIIQSAALGLGAIPVYFLSKKVLFGKISQKILKITSLALALIYLLNPAMQWTNLYDFHGVALAIPFLLAVFYFAYVKNWPLFWLFTFLALTTKEEISLLISMIGLALFFVFKERWIGILAFFLGISWFICMVFVTIPRFSADNADWAVNELYASAIQRISEIRTPPQAADFFSLYFLKPDSVAYYTQLLKPFSFMPILGLPWLLLSAPEFAVNLLSDDAQMHALTFHYDSGITPFMMISTIFGLSYLILFLKHFKQLTKYMDWLVILIVLVMLGVAIRVNYHYSPLPTTPSCWCLSYSVSQDDRDFAKVLGAIPSKASVTSSGEIRPHLTRREDSFTLPGQVNTADYVAILDQNRIVGDYSPKEFENALLKDPNFLVSHDLISHIGHFYLFKKK